MRGQPVTVVGRESELRLLSDAVRGAGPSAVVVLGEPGIGKTALLDAAASQAPGRVLRVRGVESEQELPFAALHRFVGPLLPGAERLPVRQRDALRQVFGMDDAAGETAPPARLLVGLAALTLVSAYADDGPVLVLVDDAHWIDHASLEVLGFVARRLDGEPVSLLAAARGSRPPAPLGLDLHRLALAPLSDDAARALLERQPNPPRGGARRRVLHWAAGNPLALTELAKSAQDQGGWPTATPPLTERLEAVFAAQLRPLPPETREFLLRAAITEGSDSAQEDPEACVPAERAGLITIDHDGITFRHSLIRSAVYHAASPADRRRVHRKAAAAAQDPDRRAWHLAAAAAGPDAEVARELEEMARRATRHGAYQAAVTALRRAARLSPDHGERGRLLATAAQRAIFGSQFSEVAELAAEAATLIDNEIVRAELSVLEGWTLSMTGEFHRAFNTLLAQTEPDAGAGTDLAVRGLRAAANVAYMAGTEDFRQEVLRVLPRVVDDPDDLRTVFLRASVDPIAGRARLLPLLKPALVESGADLRDLAMAGTAAAYLDETALAGAAFTRILDREQASPVPARGNVTDVVQAGIQFVTGQWDLCAQTLAASRATTTEADAPLELAFILVQQAQLDALRGDTEAARETLARALRLAPHPGVGALSVRVRWTAGIAATAEGDHLEAYERLRRLFTADGAAVHYRESYYGLGDLAAVAVRTGHRDEAAAILDRSVRELGDGPSPRLAALLARAEALLSEEPEPAFRRALGNPAGEQWPFERAQILLDQGQWLRRERRVSQARSPLTGALAVFERLRARPWADRARTELRAAGVTAARKADSAFAGLTAQQQQIARLAAKGLTNREIGERLLLSPRTIAFHLYGIFPKLNITARAQLRDIVEASGAEL